MADLRLRLVLAASLALLAATPAAASSLKLAWDANTEPEVSGYVVVYGRQPGVYSSQQDAGAATTFKLTHLLPGGRYYIAVRAKTATGLLSDPSNEVSEIAPADPQTFDFSGDGLTDLSAFRVASGGWTIDGQAAVTFGRAGDMPVAADYDGDGRIDLAAFRPATGEWFVR